MAYKNTEESNKTSNMQAGVRIVTINGFFVLQIRPNWSKYWLHFYDDVNVQECYGTKEALIKDTSNCTFFTEEQITALVVRTGK